MRSGRSGQGEPGWRSSCCRSRSLSRFSTGSSNFSYSIVLFLIIAGFVLRSGVQPTAGRTAALAALLVVAFFTHLVGCLAAGLFVLAVLGARVARVESHRRATLIRGTLALVPAAGLTVLFVVSSESASGTVWASSPLSRVAGLVTLTWGVVSYDRLEIVFCLVAAAALWTLIVLAARARRPWREREPDTIGVALFILATSAVSIVAPDAVGSGGKQLSYRLVVFPVLGALIWLGRQGLRAEYLAAGGVAALLAAGGLAVVRYDDLREVERIADELTLTIPCVEREATVVQGNLAQVSFGSAGRIRGALMAEAGRVAAARDGLDLGNIDWALPFALQRFRPHMDPRVHLVTRPGVSVEAVPPPFDLRAYERVTGEPVDYILLWGRPMMTRETRASSSWQRFDRSLHARHHLSVRSPDGWWELWTSRAGTCERALQ